MSSKKSYNRFFIIFQEEDKGYGMGPDRPPTGYAKVETRNDKSKVTVYVQNLKPFESGECLYRCYFISHQDDKDSTVYLGVMNIDDLGRGESTWECSAENAFDSKVSVDKFNGAAILVDRGGLDKVVAPLAGYMSKEKFDWRSKILSAIQVQTSSKEENIEVKAKKMELSEAAKKFEEYEESIQKLAEEKAAAEAPVEEAEPEVVKEAEMLLKEKISDPAAGNINTAPESKAGRETYNGDDLRHKYKEHKYGYYGCPDYCSYNFRHIMRKMLEEILLDYTMMGKHNELKDCVMWKVDMDKCRRDIYKVGMYPCYDLVMYPMLFNKMYNYSKYIDRHGHYLFGIKYDKDRKVLALIFAIPGGKSQYDQPFGGRTGFAKWIPWGMGDEGYWIMMYDPMTGTVITQK